MSLYRQPGRVRPLLIAAVAVVALLVGGGIGYAIGKGSAKEPSARDAVARLHDTLRPLAAGLELIPTEYPQSLQGTGSEAAAVDGDLGRIRAALAAALPDLRVLDATGAAALVSSVTALEQAVAAQAPAAEVARLSTAAHTALAGVPGGR